MLIRQERSSLLELCDARRILEVETAAHLQRVRGRLEKALAKSH